MGATQRRLGHDNRTTTEIYTPFAMQNDWQSTFTNGLRKVSRHLQVNPPH